RCCVSLFFFPGAAPTGFYTLSLHDALPISPGLRRTRRWTPASKGRIDLRRIVTRSAKYGGEPLLLPARIRVLKQRPFVLLCDVRDRKSTRLNSSHQIISYAVFCLKKKKNTE